MKLVAIGDPHGDLRKLKKIPLKGSDLILVTGDIGKADLVRAMTFENIEREKQGLPLLEYKPSHIKRAFMEIHSSAIRVMKYLSKFAPVYTIFGNVEYTIPEIKKMNKEHGLDLPYLSKELDKLPNVRVINNRIARYNGMRIGGLKYFIDTSWVKEFRPSNYDEILKKALKETQAAKKTLNWFSKVDILLCHQPPYGVLDKVKAKFAPKHWQGKHAGSKTILNYIRRYKPRFVFSGHIHESAGYKRVDRTEVYNLGYAGYKMLEL